MKEFHIQWHILNRCNLRCTHCYQDDYSANSELSIEKLKAIADNIDRSMKRWKARLNLLLTGGEPLLKEEIFELFSYLEQKQTVKQLDIITNATILSKYIDQLEKFKKCKNILFSLDGVTESTNDKIRGSGVYKKVLQEMNLVDSKRFKKILMFTVNKKNYEDAFKLVEFGKENNLDGIIIERLVPLGQSKDEFSNVLTKNMLKKLWNHLLIENGYDASKSYEYRALKIEYQKRNKKEEIYKTVIKVANCIVGQDGCAIMPDGSVFPCRRLPLVIGNLLNSELYDIFENSKILKDLTNRNLIQGKCQRCDSSFCLGCRAMVYAVKKNLYGEDPHCWK